MKVTRFLLKPILALLLFGMSLEVALQGAHQVHLALHPQPQLPHPGAPVILCVGDSFTYGVKLLPEQSYPGQLQRLLDRQGISANVVNAGVPGENTSELRRLLPGLLRMYHPALVVILSCANNDWNRTDILWSDAEDGIIANGILTWPQRLWFSAASSLRTVRLLAYVWNDLRRRWRGEDLIRDREGKGVFHFGFRRGPADSLERMIDRSGRDFRAIIGMVRAAGAQPLLMTYPGQPASPMGGANGMVRTAAESLQAPLVDIEAVIWPLILRPDGTLDQAARDRLFLTDPGEVHLAAPGYAVVSDNLLETIQRLGWLNKSGSSDYIGTAKNKSK